uniref:Pheromone-binding protein-related protein 4 n=2 Tax=Ceratitis capitata TaxID=7213 RepID=W8BDG8_CERCA
MGIICKLLKKTMLDHRHLNIILLLLQFGIMSSGAADAQTNLTNNASDQLQAVENTTPMVEEEHEMGFDFDAVVRTCNASFAIPLELIQRFNETAELPNTTDKTGMCFLKCYMEGTGLLRNWQLNRSLIRQTMWPATGDSIPVCQEEGSRESCPCKRTYAIAKCLMIRALVDARNKPIV